MRIRYRAVACAIFRCPLICTGRALGQFPVVLKQVLKEVVTPLRRRCGPSDFETAADGVSTETFTKFILPTQALLVDFGAFWFGSDVVGGNGGAVSFPEGMSAGN